MPSLGKDFAIIQESLGQANGYGKVEDTQMRVTWMAPSICDVWIWPEELKVQASFSTMSTKISSRPLPSTRDVSRMDLMTPVGPLPTVALAFVCCTQNKADQRSGGLPLEADAALDAALMQ